MSGLSETGADRVCLHGGWHGNLSLAIMGCVTTCEVAVASEFLYIVQLPLEIGGDEERFLLVGWGALDI